MNKRLFAAIRVAPDPDLLRHYYSLKQALKLDRIKWTEPENLHVTLKFFGETQEEMISVISAVIQPVVSAIPSFKMDVKGTGIFGSRYAPRVIWFGVYDGGKMAALGNEILNRLDKDGFPRDRQNFVPHLTAGRVKTIEHMHGFQQAIRKFKDVRYSSQLVEEVILYESLLKPSGPEYKVLKKYLLGK